MFVRWEKLGTLYTAGAFITVYSERNAKTPFHNIPA